MATRPTLHLVHVVLHRPLLLGGLDWRLLVFTVACGVIAMNVAERITRWDVPVGILVFLIGYGVARWLTRHEPSMVPIILLRFRYLMENRLLSMPTQHDPLRQAPVSVRVK